MTSRPRSRTALSTAALLTLALGATACGARGAGADGGGEDGYTIKFSHVVTPDTPKGQAAERFAKVVDETCGDQLSVEVYPNSELYGDEDELQALQSGAVQMLAPASAKFTTIAPQLQVLDLPFLFDSVEDIPKVVAPDTAAGKAIYENPELAKRGIKVLGLWDNGLKQLSSDDAMTQPSDLRGLRFRIQPSDVLRSQFEEWSAETTPMAFAEVYNALQQGVIDGQENPYSNIESQNMHTVQKHITESDHGYIGYVHTINKEFYDSLPAELQTCVDDASAEAATYNREVAAKLNDEAKQVIEKAGGTEITELTDEQRQVFEDAVVPKVWKQYADVIGQDLVDELLAQR
ncbi:DctP family TRAP transporter solute-binding subunit [Nocardioides iriomotensis]|uniref:DctP family TRAP transporter solute-binding subunit n=1 Tax=Nocardioides iriomotensis TaxID=715784 RepID=A0A4Q5J520_9ACTN|nr:DctP family TRAP transporter solute-binding subunit [Nocardioides iriomotensis]RYU13727.1 DctP family TRAP transporter solute-binding subunit [Nocardioides iriomotensis]